MILAALAFVTILAGLKLNANLSQLRNWVQHLISPVLDCSWGLLPARGTALFVNGYVSYVNYWFRQPENNFLVSGLFFIIVVIAIPAGAVLNFTRGGSAFLIFMFLGLVIGFVVLMGLGEMQRLKWVRSALSPVLFLALFIFVPGYVFCSFTDRLLNLQVGHAVIGSFLVAPLLYLAVQSGVLIGRQLFVGRGATNSSYILGSLVVNFSAGLPFAYFGTFLLFLAGRYLDAPVAIPMNWQTVLAGLVVGGIGLAVTIQSYEWAARKKNFFTWVSVTMLNILVPSGLAVLILATEFSHTDNAHQGILNKRIIGSPLNYGFSPTHLFWLMQLYIFPVITIFLFNGVLIVSRVLLKFTINAGTCRNYGHSRVCIIFGISCGICSFTLAMFTMLI